MKTKKKQGGLSVAKADAEATAGLSMAQALGSRFAPALVQYGMSTEDAAKTIEALVESYDDLIRGPKLRDQALDKHRAAVLSLAERGVVALERMAKVAERRN